jgi:hypothetical protein
VRMPKLTRQQKITFAEMRSSGVRGLLVYCASAAIRRRSAWTNGPITSGFPIWNRGSSAKLAAREAPTCGRTSRPRRWGYPADALVGPPRRPDTIARRRRRPQMRRAGAKAKGEIMKGYDPDGGAKTEADHFRQLSDAASTWLSCWRTFMMQRLRSAKATCRHRAKGRVH